MLLEHRAAPRGGAYLLDPHVLSLTRLFFLGKESAVCAGAPAALAYARAHFAPFQQACMPEIKQLLGCLLFAHRPLAATPYTRLAPAALLQDVLRDFVREACGLLAQVRAGAVAVLVR